MPFSSPAMCISTRSAATSASTTCTTYLDQFGLGNGYRHRHGRRIRRARAVAGVETTGVSVNVLTRSGFPAKRSLRRSARVTCWRRRCSSPTRRRHSRARGQRFQPHLVAALEDPLTGQANPDGAGTAAATCKSTTSSTGTTCSRPCTTSCRVGDRNRPRCGPRRTLSDGRQEWHRTGLYDRTGREIRRRGNRRTPARPRIVYRVRTVRGTRKSPSR